MVAFAGAVEDLSYRYLETDVRATRDGVLVTFHDATLQRTTNGVGDVADWLWEDLRHLDAAWSFGADDGFPLRGTGVRIPRLDEVFATWPAVNINIDLKDDNLEWPVADAVIRSRRVQKVLIGSFSDRRIARFRRVSRGAVATSAGTAVSVAAWAASRLGRRLPARPDAYQLPFAARGAQLDRRFVDAAHNAQAQVHAWTVNERVDMERLLDLGVDGIVTDRPDLLNEVVASRRGNG